MLILTVQVFSVENMVDIQNRNSHNINRFQHLYIVSIVSINVLRQKIKSAFTYQLHSIYIFFNITFD